MRELRSAEMHNSSDDCLFPLPISTFIPRRYQPGHLANWSGHLAFANDLIAQCKPALVTELGTHYGESYFGMCQSVLGNGLNSICYAIDHWLGEEHAGFYGEEVFTEVQEYNDRYYKSFSYLLRSTFDEALRQFADDSIDLLHIDGLHTYEAASHDLRSWLPKVRPGGIVLLHDVMVRHADFGIWKLWEELQTEFNETFTFHHSWGLGVWQKPGARPNRPELLNLLFSATETASEHIRRHYVLYASYLDRLLSKDAEPETQPIVSPDAAVKAEVNNASLQLFLPANGTHSEAASLPQLLEIGKKKTLRFDLPFGVAGPIRLDLPPRLGALELAWIRLVTEELKTPVWSADNSSLKSLTLSNSALFLPREDSCHILSYGPNTHIFLPELHHDGPLRLEVSGCLGSDLQCVLESLISPEAPSFTPGPVASSPAGSSKVDKVIVQIFPFNKAGYFEAESVVRHVEVGPWNKLTFELGAGSLEGPIRFDPADALCVVEIGEFQVFDACTGEVIVHLRESSELERLSIINSAVRLPETHRHFIFCFNRDPKLQWIPDIPFSGAVRIEVSLRIESELDAVATLLRKQDKFDFASRCERLSIDVEILKAELKASQAARSLLAAEVSSLATQKNFTVREKDDVIKQTQARLERSGELLEAAKREKNEEAKIAQARLEQLENLLRISVLQAGEATKNSQGKIDHLEELLQASVLDKDQVVRDLQARLEQLERVEQLIERTNDEKNLQQEAAIRTGEALALEKEKASRTLRSIETSLSWRVTKPMRDIMRFIRSSKQTRSNGAGL